MSSSINFIFQIFNPQHKKGVKDVTLTSDMIKLKYKKNGTTFILQTIFTWLSYVQTQYKLYAWDIQSMSHSIHHCHLATVISRTCYQPIVIPSSPISVDPSQSSMSNGLPLALIQLHWSFRDIASIYILRQKGCVFLYEFLSYSSCLHVSLCIYICM